MIIILIIAMLLDTLYTILCNVKINIWCHTFLKQCFFSNNLCFAERSEFHFLGCIVRTRFQMQIWTRLILVSFIRRRVHSTIQCGKGAQWMVGGCSRMYILGQMRSCCWYYTNWLFSLRVSRRRVNPRRKIDICRF